LLHELGHLLAYEKYGNRILPHGEQWKNEFGKILARFVIKKIFPPILKPGLCKACKIPLQVRALKMAY
jgi:hypothetical protein